MFKEHMVKGPLGPELGRDVFIKLRHLQVTFLIYFTEQQDFLWSDHNVMKSWTFPRHADWGTFAFS